ncbi:MAG: N-acetylmuramoyl-L-alanine amidase [Bacteroidales bacterium]|nr:N-acetylmuramoyl-L-alanine amidase [Bacteroidales bacterium]
MTRFVLIRNCLILLMMMCNILIVRAQDGKYELKTVVIDAGHGGKDPGALGKKSKEKDLCLAIALKVGNYIEQNVPGVNVVYTRKTDVFLDLGRRADIANEAKADVFISIHINSCKNPKVYGASTYVNGNAKDKDNLEIQKQENGGEDFKPEDYIELANIQKSNHTNSNLLAGKIQNQFRTRAGRKDLGVKQACFAVLWRAYMPAVLIEVGFISNAAEERYMISDDGQSYLASAIYRAFKEYKYQLEGKTPPAPSKPKTSTDKPAQPSTKPAVVEAPSSPSSNNDGKVYFRVQVKSSTEKIPTNSRVFKGMKNIDEILIDGVYKYTVGKTQDFNEILALQKSTRETFKDAYVIATKGNKKIDITEAKKELGIVK